MLMLNDDAFLTINYLLSVTALYHTTVPALKVCNRVIFPFNSQALKMLTPS